MRHWDSKARILLLLLSLGLVRGLIYSAVTPPWQAPDEFRHFEYIKLINEKGRLVTYKDLSEPLQREIIASMIKYDYWRFGYAPFPFDPANPPQSFEEIVEPFVAHSLYQPPLYYLLSALFLSVVSQAEITVQLYAMRLFSVILGVLTVLVAFLTMAEIFPNDDFLLISVPAFVVFLPMHTFITSSVNSDNLAELLVSLVIYIMVRILRHGTSCLKIMVSGLLVMLGWFTKRTALVSIPICVITVPLYLWGRPFRATLSRKHLASIMAVVGAIASGIILYRAKLQALLARFSARAAGYLMLPSRPLEFLFDREHYTPDALRRYGYFMQRMFMSFWAHFGCLKIRLAPIWYQIIAVVSLVAFLGLLLFALRLAKTPTLLRKWQKKCLLLLFSCVVLAIIITILGMVRIQAVYRAGPPQGRYLFPVIVPIATLFILGLRELFPRRYYQPLLLAEIGSLFLFDLICLIGYIIPFFYG